MIVRRLNALYLRVVSSALAAWRSLTRRRPVLSVAPAAQKTTRGAHYARTDWLADGRRLRTHPLPLASRTRPSSETVHQILRDPRWASAFDASRVARPPRLSNPLEARSLPEVGEAAPTRPLTSPTPTSPAADTEAEEAKRRLTLMRDLVRRGLYNEGFTPKDVPDYYRPHPGNVDLPPLEPPSLG